MPDPSMKRGFTLIELLVVIAIIAILAAILFPVFARAREKARTNSCLNNQRQILIAIQMYVQDNDETLMPAKGTWSGYLKNYNEPSIYDCPTKTGKGSNDLPEYGLNYNILGRALGDLKDPSQIVGVGDIIKGGDTLNPPYTLSVTNNNVNLDTRHNGGAVMAFLDGHTDYLPVKSGQTKLDALYERGWQVNLVYVRDVEWTPNANVKIDYPLPGAGSKLAATTPINGQWSAGSVGIGVIKRDGWISWRCDTGNASDTMVGLTSKTALASYGDVTIAIYTTGPAQAYYGPGLIGTPALNTNYNYAGTFFTVERKNGVVTYAVDGVVKHTAPGISTGDLRAAAYLRGGAFLSRAKIYGVE